MNREELKSFLSQIKPDRWDCDILCEMIDNLTDEDIMGLLSENRSCMTCKRVDKCKLANDIRDNYGLKLKEMCFYCWEQK